MLLVLPPGAGALGAVVGSQLAPSPPGLFWPAPPSPPPPPLAASPPERVSVLPSTRRVPPDPPAAPPPPEPTMVSAAAAAGLAGRGGARSAGAGRARAGAGRLVGGKVDHRHHALGTGDVDVTVDEQDERGGAVDIDRGVGGDVETLQMQHPGLGA